MWIEPFLLVLSVFTAPIWGSKDFEPLSFNGFKNRCLDRDTQCPVWATNGECLNNPGIMRDLCSKTCVFCVNLEAFTQPSNPDSTTTATVDVTVISGQNGSQSQSGLIAVLTALGEVAAGSTVAPNTTVVTTATPEFFLNVTLDPIFAPKAVNLSLAKEETPQLNHSSTTVTRPAELHKKVTSVPLSTTATPANTTTNETESNGNSTKATPSNIAGCSDTSLSCKAWSSLGECQRNVAFMRLNCSFTCGFCIGGGEKCPDGHKFCPFWAGIGECENNPAWMKPNCRTSCNACDFAAGATLLPNIAAATTVQPTATSSASATSTTAGQTANSQPTGTAATITQALPKSGSLPQRCIQINQQSPEQTSKLLRQEGLVTTKEAPREGSVNLDILRKSNTDQLCVPATSGNIDCVQDVCYNLMYRNMDGTCNNNKHPNWGAAFTQYERLLPPIYDDGLGAPVATILNTRPSARDISHTLLSSNQVVNNNEINMMIMQWGQFIGHDVGRTTMLPNSKCTSCTNVDPTCMSVLVKESDPNNDVFHGCVRFSRNSPVCGVSPRQQINENTAFIDGSQMYGSSVADAAKLRDGATGLLKLDQFNDRPVLPFDHSSCSGPTSCTSMNFRAGDDRVNLFIGLSSMHIVLAREHNRVVRGLQALNPQWDGERLFQESRKIVGAVSQAITYKEWLPKVLGPQVVEQSLGAYRGYDPNVNPAVANHFQSATFRFGHAMLIEFYQRLGANGESIPQGGINFTDAMLHNDRLMLNGGLDPLLRGMLMTPVKRPHRITTSVTEKMFGSQDLAAINIGRGRDHGIPSYNAWREFCRLPRAKTMDDLAPQILTPQIRDHLQNLYQSPDNIDLYVGILLEDPIQGSLVGPTLACLIGDQFRRTRDGDRFWYQNPGIFSAEQVAEIDKTSMARLLCDNTDGSFTDMPSDAFRLDTSRSTFVRCGDVPSLNLQPWKE